MQEHKEEQKGYQRPDWSRIGGASSEAQYICFYMLCKNEAERPTAQELLSNSWFVQRGLGQAQKQDIEKLGKGLMQVRQRTAFERFVARLVATQMDAGQLRRINEAFRTFDVDKDGTLSRDELVQGLGLLGARPEEVQRVVDELDVGKTGRISYTEFLAGVADLRSKTPEQRDKLLRLAWQQFNPDAKGMVKTGSIQAALAARGLTVAELPKEFLNELRTLAAVRNVDKTWAAQRAMPDIGYEAPVKKRLQAREAYAIFRRAEGAFRDRLGSRRSQICAGRRQAAGSEGSHRTKSGSKLQVKLGPVAQSERQKGVHEPLSEKVLLAAEEFLYYGRHEAIAELRVPEASEKSGATGAREARFLFNGDVADRGRNAIVHMNRGNHEEEGMNCKVVFFMVVVAAVVCATVIEKSVFVVHGGLSRCPHPLRLLRSLHERPSSLPTEPATAAEQVMIDFLWADPCDMPGLSPSKRGGQMIRFGPDVTKQFLEDSGFALVVRSHEVPKNNDGVYVMHENRLVTVFSASNYMGSVGNHGAVLLFHASGGESFLQGEGKLSFNESRHFAPALNAREFALLRSTLEDALGLPREQTDIPRLQLQAAEMAITQSVPQEDPQQDRLPKELLRQVAQLVVEQKPALFAFFFAHDVSKTGFIDVQDWLQGCRAVLGDLPWEQLRQLLAVEEPGSNMVDYVAFVHRFRVGLAGSEISDEWAQILVSRVFERLIYSDWPITQMLHHFDRDGNGTVTAAELREAFVELDVGITGPQAFSLLRTMTAHGTADQKRAGGISIESFLSLFEMTFHPHATGQVRVPGWVTASLRVLGGLIWQGTSGEDRARQFFERADANGNGLLSLPELVAGITQLCQAESVDLQLTRKDFLDLAKWVDISGEGQVNYVEFLKAFLPAGLSDGSFQADIMESICLVLLQCGCFNLAMWRIMNTLRICLVAPRLGTGIVIRVWTHMRFGISKAARARTEQVRYRRFLDSFQVFDTAPTWA
ncbi:PAPP5 [Symbiodinium sp. KB8]|nr:PAPP5 [Symbiodinium sp. KB8]